MKAIVCTKYGSPDVLKLREIKTPEPGRHEVLVKVYATTVASGDCRVRGLTGPALYRLPMRIVLGFSKPRNPVLGTELAGEIIAVGKDVARFKVGDRVFAFTGMRFGGYAEYACLPAGGLITLKPANMSYEEAAAVLFGGTTALHFLRKANVQRGCRVLLYGASGSVGTSAVQLARHFGATVTAVCSAANAQLVQALGADRVIDYAKEDFASGGKQYDIVFDAVGKAAKSSCRKALAPGGAFVSVLGQGMARVPMEHVLLIKKIAELGRLRAVIDRRYTFEQIPDAHRYVELGHKKGNVVVTVCRGDSP